MTVPLATHQPNGVPRRSLRIEEQLNEARLAHLQVVLSGPGVHDLLVDGAGRAVRLPKFIRSYCQARGLGLVSYRLGEGVVSLPTLPGEQSIAVMPAQPEEDPADVVAALVASLRTANQPAILLLDYLDNQLPTDRLLSPEQSRLMEQLQALAGDPSWHQAGLQTVLVDRGGGLVARLVQHPGVEEISVGAPDETEATLFISRVQTSARSAPLRLVKGFTAEDAARRSRGLLNLSIQQLALTSTDQRPVTAERLSERKADAIRQMSGGTLELITDRLTFDQDVAGLAAVRLEVVETQLRGADKVRLLLCGPAGTGKTLSATAIGGMLQVPVVRFGQILDPYIGVAEQRMTQSVRLLRNLAPLLLFIDEADQKGLGGRGRIGESHQVYQNLRAILFEFLGDSAADDGISVVAATNVASRLDDAARSRLTAIPVLFASGSELAQIMAIQGRRTNIPIADDLAPPLTEFLDAERALSGRSAPQILHKAWARALRAGRSQVAAADIAATLDGWVGNDWTTDAEYSTLTSMLAAGHRDAWPWVAAAQLGSSHSVPAYLQPYMAHADQIDLKAIRRRVDELERAGVYHA